MALAYMGFGPANFGVRANVAFGAETKDDGIKLSLKNYTAYSIGCAVVWAVILAAVASKASKETTQTFFLLFLGWGIGWLSATIAMVVYPPPKSWRPVEKAP
jgi:hypothetical protein